MLEAKEVSNLRCEKKMYMKEGNIERKEASFYLKNRTMTHPVIKKLMNDKILIC